MPEKLDLDNIYTEKFQIGNDEIELISGRAIFDEASFTMLNKRPVGELKAHILKGATVDGDNSADTMPFTPAVLCENLLVDGSLAIFSYGDTYEFLPDAEVIDAGLVYQWLNIGEDNEMLRQFVLSLDEKQTPYWLVTEYEGYGTDDEQAVDTYSFTNDQLYAYSNGKGILHDPQLMYRRLEEIENIIKEQTKKANLKTIVTGYTGNINQAKHEFVKDNRIVFMDGDNVKVIEVANPEIIQKLLDQSARIEPRYLASCHIAMINDVAGISGISRKYIMTPMTSFVDTVRGQITEIFTDFGYGITFGKNIIDDVDERSKEYDLLFKAQTDGAITEDGFKAKVSNVLI
jgi:hypothetical protein